MKQFMYVSIGIVALMASFHLGAQVGRADWQQVIGLGYGLSGAMAVFDTGEILSWDSNNGWQGRPRLPFPPEELKFFEGEFAMDTANHLWYFTYGHWEEIGPPPGVAGVGDPSLTPATWGQIKASR